MTDPTDIDTSPRQIAVIGGGAAGFFAAITAAEHGRDVQVTVFEQGHRVLRKVKVSGGGRCNVTHACFEPRELVSYYPRGGRELLGAFHRWQPRDTFEWFVQRGVSLKTESDGRVFPESDNSQTIIDCLLDAARDAGVVVRTGIGVTSLDVDASGAFQLGLSDGGSARATRVCMASGSWQPTSGRMATKRGAASSDWIVELGHTMTPLAPSLFAFDIRDWRLEGLAGLSVPQAQVRVLPDGAAQSGPVLLTHRGLSGPAILKLSSWEARALQQRGYRFDVAINWLGTTTPDEVAAAFTRQRHARGTATVAARGPFDILPRRLWTRMVEAAGVSAATRWCELSRDAERALTGELIDARFEVRGKTTNKEEFVTCGGIRLDEVDFRTMESRLVPGLHFAGECLDIDGLTGGFNFQAAWTGGHIAGMAMSRR